MSLDDYRRHLDEALHAASRDYDQAILAISAGTLAVSVTFVHDITPTPVAGTKDLLLIGWGGLVVAMVAIVASFLTSQALIRGALAAIVRGEDPPQGTLASWATFILNALAGSALVVGLVSLGVYAYRNLV